MMMMTKTSMKNPISQKFQSPFLRPRNKSKSKSNKQTLHFEEEQEDEQQQPSPSSPRVSHQEDDDDVTTSESPSVQQLGFKASKDLVWAKAFPHTWWPGYKLREYRGKFLVSFFKSDKSLWFHESEMEDFEADFKEMTAKRRFEPDGLDSALEEFGKRLSVELMCCCGGDEVDEERVEVNDVKVGFEAVDVLNFVRRVGVRSSFEEVESVGVVRDSAYVNAFRRCAFIKRDWIYDETMRVEEYKEIMGGAEGDAESEAVLKDTRSERELKSRQMGAEDEQVEEEHKVELEHVEELEEEGEGTLKEIWEKVKKGSVAKKKEPLEQKYFIASEEITEKEVFQPVEALTFVPVEVLAFVRRLAISPWVNDRDTHDVIRAAAQVSRFRSYLYKKSYENTTRLTGSTNELEDTTKSAFTEDEERVVQATRLPDDEEENKYGPISEGVRSGPVTCKTIIEDPLHDILNHLFCLALDPFYLGAESYGAKCSDAACEKILRYRKKVYQCPTLRRSLYRDSLAEISEAHEFSEGCLTSHHCDLSVGILVEDNSCAVNDEVNQESELLSDLWNKHKKRPRVWEKSEDVKVNCSTSNVEDVVVDLVRGNDDSNYESGNKKWMKDEDVNGCVSFHDGDGKDVVDLTKDVPEWEGRFESSKRQKIEVCDRSNVKGEEDFDVSRDTSDCNRVSKSNKRQELEDMKDCGRSYEKGEDDFDISRDIPDCNRVSKSNKRQKLSMYDSGSHFQGGSTETLEGHNSVSIHDDLPGSKLSLHVGKDHLNSEHCTEAGANGTNVNLKVGCRADDVFGSLSDGTLSEEIISNKHEDTVGGAFSPGPVCGYVAPDNIGGHLSSGATADLSIRELSVGKNHRGRSEKSANRSEYSNNRTVKSQEPKILQPLTMLYLSPLSAENPASNSNSQFQLRKADAHSEHPATLHMKFPKDFKLPSKDELVKKFRPFGPIDYAKTKVFFYTGSAQVGFLQHHDAEAACHYAKKKDIFVGGANIRFWLDQREQLRSRSKDVSAPSSLPTATSSLSELRPCLKVSNPLGIKVDRKDLRVKFPSNGQVLPPVSVKTKNGVFTQSESCRYSNAVSPDISLEMIELLEKCNQTVTKIKDSLGLQSFYSLFTHNYCHSGFDEV